MSKISYLIIALCFTVTSATFWLGNFWQMAHVEEPGLILFDSGVLANLDNQVLLDPEAFTKVDLYTTRAFHNKPLAIANAFWVNLSRSTDPTFIFNLTKNSSSYDDRGFFHMLYPFELPFFLLAGFFWIKYWSFFKKNYSPLLLFLIGTLLICVFVWPTFYLPKFFPYLVMLRIFIYVSLWVVLSKRFQLSQHLA